MTRVRCGGLEGSLCATLDFDVVRVAEKRGWVYERRRGDHLTFQKSGTVRHFSIPFCRDLAESILHGLIRTMDLSIDEFVELAKK